MDDLTSLELLSLVSKVTSELQNHLGITDKTLAEFVINQHEQCGGKLPEFKTAMAALGAEFPNSLVESIDRLILTMHPKYKKQRQAEKVTRDDMDELDAIGRKAQTFKGLAVPDQDPDWDDLDDDVPGQKAIGTDNTFALLADLAPRSKGSNGVNGHSRKRSRSPDRDDYPRDRRPRQKYVSRSPSPYEEKRSRRRYDEEEHQDRSHKHRHRDDKNGHHRSRRRDYDDQEAGYGRRPAQELDDHPELYKVYDGAVTGIKDFGAFVNLRGVKGKVDGLVHVSAIQDGARVNHPSDLLSRGQPVKVKVVKIEGTRIGLSMKEVDQESGRNLVPARRIATGANMERSGGASNGRYGGLSDDVPVIEDELNGKPNRSRKRMTSPERWEIKQLIASGAISAHDYPDIDEDFNAAMNGEGNFEEEEDIDIEVREEEPPFLAGQTKQSLELSPIRVVKAPEGSLNRAAQAGTKLGQGAKRVETAGSSRSSGRRSLKSQPERPMAGPYDQSGRQKVRFRFTTSWSADAEGDRCHSGMEACDSRQESVLWSTNRYDYQTTTRVSAGVQIPQATA